MSSLLLLVSLVFALFSQAFQAAQREPAPVPQEPVIVEASAAAACCWWNGRKWICSEHF